MKIIVVDDETIVLDSCRVVLTAEGFDVVLVESAYKALKAIEDETPALLLIDIKMPKHDGIFLMGEVKEKWPDIPIIAMSGYPTQDTIADAEKMGIKTFLAKPFTPDELLEKVRQVIHKEESNGKKEGPGN